MELLWGLPQISGETPNYDRGTPELSEQKVERSKANAYFLKVMLCSVGLTADRVTSIYINIIIRVEI